MSREQRHIEISVVVDKPEHLGEHPVTGEPMYADDVVVIMRTYVQDAVDEWYRMYGGERWLCTEPLVN